MLTKQEKKWLKERENRPAPCGYRQGDCRGCLFRFCILMPDYQDAAEFEAQVQRALMYQYEKAYHCKEVSGSFMPDRDTMLMYARLDVERRWKDDTL